MQFYYDLQHWIWGYDPGAATLEDLEPYKHVSMKAMYLGLTFDGDFVAAFFTSQSAMMQWNCKNFDGIRETCKFFLSHGMNIENVGPHGQTPLLNVAEAERGLRSLWMQALLRSGAAPTALDSKGRGSLHLTLTCSQGQRPFLSSDLTTHTKLVLLLQADS